MRKRVLMFILFANVSQLNAIPLFAKVVNVANNDDLNIRAMSNYHSKKVGTVPNSALLGVDICKKVGDSKWCKVHLLAQMVYGNTINSGWVNAKFLKFSNKGYVNIKGQKNSCYYAIGCKNGSCKVVVKINWSANRLNNVVIKKIN